MLEKKSFIGFCGEPLKHAFQISCEIANLIGCHRVAVKLRLKGKSLPGCPGSDRFKQFLKYKWNLKLGAKFQIIILLVGSFAGKLYDTRIDIIGPLQRRDPALHGHEANAIKSIEG